MTVDELTGFTFTLAYLDICTWCAESCAGIRGCGWSQLLGSFYFPCGNLL